MKSTTFPLTLNLKLFCIILIISIISLLIIYIFQINSFTKELYFIQNSEKKLELLNKENEALKIGLSKADSLANIESFLQSQNFEKVSQVKYIQIYRPVVKKK